MELTIGERLILLRFENGFPSQEKFGELFSLSKSAINNYENDLAKPDFETVKKISEYFHVSYDYLFGISNSKDRQYHDVVDKLGLSEKSIERLIEFSKNKELSYVMNYIIEADLMPTLVELFNRYIKASIESIDRMTGKTYEDLISADNYVAGLANEELCKYAAVHCFTDILESSPSIDNFPKMP